MDRSIRSLLNSTVSVRRVSSYTPAGTEVLAAAVVLPAYVEVRRANGRGPGGTERRTTHVAIVDPVDVAASALGTLTADDRFWLEGASASDPTFSGRPDDVTTYKDPLTGALSHYEVTL